MPLLAPSRSVHVLDDDLGDLGLWPGIGGALTPGRRAQSLELAQQLVTPAPDWRQDLLLDVLLASLATPCAASPPLGPHPARQPARPGGDPRWVGVGWGSAGPGSGAPGRDAAAKSQ